MGRIETSGRISVCYAQTSTLSGKEGLVGSSLVVGNVILEKFHETGLSDGLNLKDSKRMDNTISVSVSGRTVYNQLQSNAYSSPAERI